MKSYSLLFGLLVSLPAFGCSVSAEPASENDDSTDEAQEALTRGTVKVTEADDGKVVRVKPGQRVVLKLSANPSTGYAWSVARTDRTFGYPTTSFRASSGAVGSGGVESFTWRTDGPLPMLGAHRVELEYKRPWETGAPARTFSFTADVRDLAAAVVVDETANGSTVDVVNGQDLVISLSSNPSTGYGWEVVSTDRTFGYPTQSYVSGGSAIGSGGTDKFTWKTTSPLPMTGTHTVKLEYKRSWETAPAARSFQITVNVVD